MLSTEEMTKFIKESPVGERCGNLLIGVVKRWPQMVSDLAGEVPPIENTAVLTAYVMDDSGSMDSGPENGQPNIATVRDCFNDMLGAIRTSTISGNVMASCLRLNGGVLYPFTPIIGNEDALTLTDQNYVATGFTPLHDRILIALAAIVLRQAMLRDLGFICGTTSLVVLSDGLQEGATPLYKVGDISHIMQSLIRSKHVGLTAYAMGVQHPATQDFGPMFAEIGFPDNSIFVAGSRDEHAIRRMFGAVTRGVIDEATRVLAGPYGNFGEVTSHSTPTPPPTIPDIHKPAQWWDEADNN